MRIARNVILPACFLLLVACAAKSQTTLSGDSAQEMQLSIMKAARDLPPDRREEFERAVETIMLSSTDRGLSVDGDRLTPQAISVMKGRTVGEVIENAKLIRSASASL